VRDHWTAGPLVAGDGGIEVATWDLGGDGPPLLLAHGTGFHAKVWLPAAGPLRPHFHVWAVDQRGHGSSGHAPDGDYSDWDRFALDLLAVADAIGGGQPLYGAGHSLGGGVLLRCEQLRPGTFGALYCYEPAVVPKGYEAADDGSGLSELARKRRACFASREDALANYAGKPPFAAFDREVLEGYVAHGFVDEPDGSVRLACRPEEEASVFGGAAASRAWDELDRVAPPVTVGRGRDLTGAGAVASAVADRLPDARLEIHGDLDHFGPMVAPARIGAAIAAALDAARVGG
jgi:pimeloyl-ACP methyl ester carboxylesterase